MLTTDILSFFSTAYTQVHHTHHVTTSFSVHKALNTFYDEWDELTDSFIETYQGKYGRIEGTFSTEASSSIDIRAFITNVRSELYVLNTQLAKEDTDLLNLVADMIGLCSHTLYMLSLS